MTTKTKIILTTLLTILIVFTGCSEDEASDTEEKRSTDEPQVTEEVAEHEPETINVQGESENQSVTTEELIEQHKELGKNNPLSEEEMIQIGEDAIKKFEENINFKTMDDFEAWHDEVMYNNDYYDSFKENTELNKYELISVEVESTSVTPHTSYSFSWSGIVKTTYKDYADNNTYTLVYSMDLLMNEQNRGQQDYKIFRFDATELEFN